MQPESPNKQKSKKNFIQSLNLELLFNTQSKQQLKKIVNDSIRPISFRNKQQLQAKIKITTGQRYLDKESKEITKQGKEKLIRDIQLLNSIFKEVQVSSPIVDAFNFIFFDFLINTKKNNLMTHEDLLGLWDVFPFRSIQIYLEMLNLTQTFKNQNKEKFTKTLISLINDGKLLAVCVYYKIYGRLPEFEQEILIPKIINTDQIYSPVMIDLFRSNKQLKQNVIQNIDQAKAVIILQHLQQDPRIYPSVNKYILRKHYLSMCHQYNEWFIFQDKMSFNPIFLQWYCDEKQLSQDIKQSIKFRNNLGGKQEKVPNPLFIHDGFRCSQAIFSKFQKGQQEQKKQQGKHVSLQQFGIREQNVHFIDSSSSQSFETMVKTLQNCQYVGFDAQNRCTSTKYEQLGVALIQISTGKQVYLIDFINLDNDKKFVEFFTKLLSNPNAIIVGHSIQSDMKFIQRTMKIQSLNGFADIAKLFKQKFPNQTQNSLAFMTNFMLGKQLSKYEQRSNWNRRPLKRSQAHYAALDAQICLILYSLLKQQEVKLTQAIIKNKKKTIINLIREQNIVYQQGQQQLLKRIKPKFLVDSMLKKLCTILRNLGIDAEYVAVSNFQLMQETAKNQQRIILTRDRKLLSKKSPKMPIYCIAQKGDSDLMLQQIKKQFHIDLSLFTPLSRCVKCNCPQLEIIKPQQALKYLNFEYEDTKIQEFWRCMKCKQIYWQGNQFKNAKKKFQSMNSS